MKVFLQYNKEDWIVDRMALEFQSRWPNYISNNLESSDIIWSWSPTPLNHNRIPIVTTVHHIDATKYNSSFYKAVDSGTSHYVTFCDKTKSAMESYPEFTKSIKVLPYWVNTNIWSPMCKQTSRITLGIPLTKYVIGSFQRDTEGSDLISPKLSKGPDRFCDYVEKLQSLRKDIHVLLGGWRRQYVINRLTEKGIPFTYLEKPPIDRVNQMYNSCDLYVVGSRCEGGPQSILECAATKTPIVSTDVGIASEILSPSCIFNIDKHTYFPNEADVAHAYTMVSKRSLHLDLGHVNYLKSLTK
tara:strand:+ start:2306 stop:3205 length:900 start_codon:yes stop_codon:yes gene_type:complete